MKVTPCYYTNGHMNQCACAIAVRASSDVYVIDKCPETVPSFFGFKSCVEDLLYVVKRSNDEHQYEVFDNINIKISLNISNNGICAKEIRAVRSVQLGII